MTRETKQEYLIATTSIIWPDKGDYIFIYASDYAFKFEYQEDGAYVCKILRFNPNKNSSTSEEMPTLEKFAGWLQNQNKQAYESFRTSLEYTQKTPSTVLITDAQKQALGQIGFYLSDKWYDISAKNIYRDGSLVFGSVNSSEITHHFTSTEAQTLTARSTMSTNIDTTILNHGVTINIQKKVNQQRAFTQDFLSKGYDTSQSIYFFVSFSYNRQSSLNFEQLIAEIQKVNSNVSTKQ